MEEKKMDLRSRRTLEGLLVSPISQHLLHPLSHLGPHPPEASSIPEMTFSRYFNDADVHLVFGP